jgi:protein gp37
MTTKIEWVKNPDGSQGYTWNPITGCLNHVNGLCKGGGFPCYAYKLANGRLKGRYLANTNLAPNAKGEVASLNISGQTAIARLRSFGEREDDYIDPFYPRFWEEKLDEIWKLAREKHTKIRGIFVCDMSDLFGIGVPDEWTKEILDAISHASPHRFYLLTKQPAQLSKFSPFPENCWVGVTATDTAMAWIASKYLSQIEAGVKFLSIEPLLSWKTSTPYTTENIVAGLNGSLAQLIIGACTGTLEDIKRANYEHKDTDGLMPMPWGSRWTLQPPIAWLREIVKAADRAGIKVFLKDNLKPLLQASPLAPMVEYPWAYRSGQLRQEMPDVPIRM